MSLDSILNQGEEESRRSEEEMSRRENEFVSFMKESARKLELWQAAFLLAHDKHKLKHDPEVLRLEKKVIALSVLNNHLYNRYEACRIEMDKALEEVNKALAPLKRDEDETDDYEPEEDYDADDSEDKEFISSDDLGIEKDILNEINKAVNKLEAVRDLFYNICDEGLKYKARFNELKEEIAALKK